ncbi:hypothetical protein LINGRAHAP2_LOCUS6947 [Linum grandiflorum]
MSHLFWLVKLPKFFSSMTRKIKIGIWL